jgi:hypothetical protein
MAQVNDGLAIDLSVEYPRSPRERLAGLDLLARTIDIARAELAGTLGDYTYWSCAFNPMLFDTLGVTDSQFLQVVREAERAAAPGAEYFLESVRESLENDDFVSDRHIRSAEARRPIDNFIVNWVDCTAKPTAERIAKMNADFEQLAPKTPEQRAQFTAELTATGAASAGITTYAALLDLQEGRLSTSP